MHLFISTLGGIFSNKKDVCLSILLWTFFFYCFDHVLSCVLSGTSISLRLNIWMDPLYLSTQLKFL